MVQKMKGKMANKMSKIAEEAKKKSAQIQEDGKAYATRVERIRLGNSFVQNQVKGLYFLERANMIASQVEIAKSCGVKIIAEKVDGACKSVNYAQAEYFMLRMSALSCFRQSYFDKVDLLKLGLSVEEIDKLKSEMLDAPVLQEKYDESYKRERGVYDAE